VSNPGRIFSFKIIFVIDRGSLGGGSVPARHIPTQNRRTLTYMPRVGFERATAVDAPGDKAAVPVSSTRNTPHRCALSYRSLFVEHRMSNQMHQERYSIRRRSTLILSFLLLLIAFLPKHTFPVSCVPRPSNNCEVPLPLNFWVLNTVTSTSQVRTVAMLGASVVGLMTFIMK
jgi:hypothetical protein